MILADPPLCSLQSIALRPLAQGDLAAWYAYLSDPAVIEYTSWDPRGPQTLAALLCRYESSEPAAPLRFAIVDERQGDLLGTVGLHTICLEHRTAEIAYDLATCALGPRHRHSGLWRGHGVVVRRSRLTESPGDGAGDPWALRARPDQEWLRI